MATLPLALALALLLVGRAAAADTAFYELLGVKQDASTRDIRRAFKRIALEKHPDKNPDKEGAHDEFVRINRAFEVLKDKDLRKKYDLHGEKGLEDDQHQRGNQYQGWGYYNEVRVDMAAGSAGSVAWKLGHRHLSCPPIPTPHPYAPPPRPTSTPLPSCQTTFSFQSQRS